MDNKSLEIEQLRLDREKFEQEKQFRERELLIKEKEIAYNRSKVNTTHVAIIVAILGVSGTIITALIQGDLNRKLERQKFESEMILKVAASDNIEQNKKNLQFFINSGYISDPQKKVSDAVSDSVFKLNTISKPDTDASIRSNDHFEFENCSLQEMLEVIAVWYGKELVVYSKSSLNTKFYCWFPRSNDVKEVLGFISLVSDVFAASYKDHLLVGCTTPPVKVYIQKAKPDTIFHTAECSAFMNNIKNFRAVPFEQALDLGYKKLCDACAEFRLRSHGPERSRRREHDTAWAI